MLQMFLSDNAIEKVDKNDKRSLERKHNIEVSHCFSQADT